MMNIRGRTILLVSVLAAVMTSGCAQRNRGLSLLAVPGTDGNYVGRYVGGGRLFGRTRHPQEGVWARDYAGLDVFHLFELRWSHTNEFRQGGMGSY
jgi:hypothetical protein